MIAEERRIILITGMSGTGIARSLGKFCSAHPLYEVIDVEDRLPDAVRPFWRIVKGQEGRPTFRQVFQLPEQLLQKSWPDALELATKAPDNTSNVTNRTVNLEKPPHGTVLLRTRACWYHMESRGLIPGASAEALRQLPRRPEMVVTLIDDVYDTLVRLRRRHEIFDEREYGGRPPTRRLLKIAAWREAETHYSQEIARALEVPFVLFAVKQPVSSLAKLLESRQEDWLYLSHPISSVRTEENDPPQQDLPEFLARLSDELQRYSRYAVFEPTSIDEARFDRAADLSVQSHVLRRRWPISRAPRELLWDSALSPAEVRFCEQPFERFGDEPTESLRLLAAELDDQIRWRDRQLVAQARGLIAVRPFANAAGEVSGGVRVEVQLHNILRASNMDPHESDQVSGDAKRRRPICYLPESDEAGRRLAGVLSVLQEWAWADGRAQKETGARIENWNEGTKSWVTERLSPDLLSNWRASAATDIGRELDEGILQGTGDDATGQGDDEVWLRVSASGVMPGGEGATYYDDALKRLGGDIKKVLTGELADRHPLSLAPYGPEVCDRIEGWYDGGHDLAIELRKMLDRQEGTSE